MDLKDKIMSVFWGRNVSKERAWEELAESIEEICREHFLDNVAWYVNEVNLHLERAEELEVDLMIEQNRMVKFPVPGRGAFETNVIKKRSNFK